VAYLHLKSGSQLIRGVRRTLSRGRRPTMNTYALIAAAVLVGAAPSGSNESRHTTPSAAPGRIGVRDASFALPARCTFECRHAVDAYHGTMRCAKWPLIDYYAGLMARPPFASDSSVVQGRQAMGTATAYWGRSPRNADPSDAYCVVLQHPRDGVEPPNVVSQQFCTSSRDPRLHQLLRDLVLSYKVTEPDGTCAR
jgi:hypothetical protein